MAQFLGGISHRSGSLQVVLASGAIVLVVEQDAVSGTLEVFILARAQAPDEGREPQPAQEKGHRDQVEQAAHRWRPPARRRALPTTKMEEADMLAAAISGVTP